MAVTSSRCLSKVEFAKPSWVVHGNATLTRPARTISREPSPCRDRSAVLHRGQPSLLRAARTVARGALEPGETSRKGTLRPITRSVDDVLWSCQTARQMALLIAQRGLPRVLVAPVDAPTDRLGSIGEPPVAQHVVEHHDVPGIEFDVVLPDGSSTTYEEWNSSTAAQPQQPSP